MCCCCCNCISKCAVAFGLGLIVGSFFESGFALFFAGVAVIILSFCLKRRR